MDAATVVALVDLLERRGVDVWLDGGWGVDALLGYQDREHDDLDVVAELRHSQTIIDASRAANSPRALRRRGPAGRRLKLRRRCANLALVRSGAAPP
jgi:hypothetical protein